MIIYGSKSTELAKKNLREKCPSCGTENSVTLYVFQKYAHIFWIPVFPLNKLGVSECSHCKQVLEHAKFSPALATGYKDAKAETKTPIWTFSGIAVFVALVSLGIYNDKKTGERNAQLILTPQSGDLFEVKTEDSQYTLYKVDDVIGDSVFIRVNTYETNKRTGLGDLKTKDYSELTYGFTKVELKNMLEKGEILDIERH